MRPLRILQLMHEDTMPPESIRGISDKEMAPWKTDYDVWAGLCNLGHEVLKLGVSTDLAVIRNAIDDFRPHITFNLLEEFHGTPLYDHHVVAYLELLKKPYTGCNPRGLMLAHDKALSKSVLTYHRIRVPDFYVFPVGRKVRRPRKLQFPLFVKSLVDEGSLGISQASIVYDDEKLTERVEFIHRYTGSDAIAEHYIEGRELYVGIMGNARLQTFPVWELRFTKLPEDSEAIATSKIKWDIDYQKKVGVKTGCAKGIPDEVRQRIIKVCKRTYRLLNLTGYARIDLRLDADDRVFVIEANPNPQLAFGEDFAESAEADGLEYESLLGRIINLGLNYRPAWREE